MKEKMRKLHFYKGGREREGVQAGAPRPPVAL